MSWEFHYRGMVPKHHLVWKKQWTGFYIIVLLLIKWKKWCCSKFWWKGSCLFKNALLKSIVIKLALLLKSIVIKLALLLFYQVCLFFYWLFFRICYFLLTYNRFNRESILDTGTTMVTVSLLRSLKLPETKKSQEKEEKQ